MTVIIEYATISPAVLAMIIEKGFECLCNWREVDEESFEFSVLGCSNLAGAEKVLAKYV